MIAARAYESEGRPQGRPSGICSTTIAVMAGLGPAIHVFLYSVPYKSCQSGFIA